MAERRARPKQRSTSETAEWVVAVISAILVLGLMGFLAFEAVTQTGGLPSISLAVKDVVQTSHGYNALVSVTNHGSATAADVALSGRAGDEESQVVLDFSPAMSERQVSLIFRNPVGPDDIELQVRGYVDP